MKQEDLTRATLRYQCYAMREQGKCDKAFSKFIKEIEAHEKFSGWHDFAMKWDIVTKGPEKELVLPIDLKFLNVSEQDNWNGVVNRLAKTGEVKGIAKLKGEAGKN